MIQLRRPKLFTGQHEITNEERSYHVTGKIYQVYDPFMEFEAKYQFQNMTIT